MEKEILNYLPTVMFRGTPGKLKSFRRGKKDDYIALLKSMLSVQYKCTLSIL